MDTKTKKLAHSLNWSIVTAYGHGGYHYNPHVSKPVALEPIGEEGGYHYFGPPPDYGGSYGNYSDGENTIISPRMNEVFSPMRGSKMQYMGPSSYEAAKKALNGSKFANLLHSCASCGSAYVTSADYLKELNCPACGYTCDYGSALMRGRHSRKDKQ